MICQAFITARLESDTMADVAAKLAAYAVNPWKYYGLIGQPGKVLANRVARIWEP